MKLRINGIGTYGSGGTIGPVCWPHHDLIVVTEGSLTLRCGRRAVTLLAHDAVLIPPGMEVAGTADKMGGAIWVQHFSATSADLPLTFRSRTRPMFCQSAAGSEFARMLMRRLHLLRGENGGEKLRLRHALFRSLLLELALAPRNRPVERRPETQRMQPALAWAETNLYEARNLRIVAARAKLSESHFRSLFRRQRGQPAGAWLRERRMDVARQLLASTGLSLKEIAARLGYSDMVSFNRAFSQHHGTPPGRFRRTRVPVV